MRFIETLLGFVVLSGPLWLILILLPVSVWIAVKASKHLKPRIIRFAGGIATFLAILFLPFADEIVGRFYLSYLCSTQAGVKVYQTVDLPKEYWDAEGKPAPTRFRSRTPGIMVLLGSTEPLLEEYPFTEQFLPILGLEKGGFRLREIKSDQTVGDLIYFRHWGGWIIRNFTPNRSAKSCDLKELGSLEQKVFSLPATSK